MGKIVLFLILILSSHLYGKEEAFSSGKARNVILMIGDGYGINMLTITRIYSVGVDGKLAVEKLSQTALCRTHSENFVVTDSGASASALATGCKFPNYSINVLSDGKKPALISQMAKKSGRSAGVVTTTRLTDATPAAFYGYVDKRQKEEELVDQLIESDMDVALGGGIDLFSPKSDLLRKRGWNFIKSASELKSVESNKQPLLGTFAADDFKYADEKPDFQPSLKEMSLTAIRKLNQNPKGYFLMIEGGMIDKAEHQNWAWRAIQEAIEFDKTIEAVCQEVGEDTLLLVTADHETGGISLNGYPPREAKGNDLLARQKDQSFLIAWASGPGALHSTNELSFLNPLFRQPAARYTPSGLHTANDVFVAARGPGSEEIHGFLENTDLFKIMRRAFGF